MVYLGSVAPPGEYMQNEMYILLIHIITQVLIDLGETSLLGQHRFACTQTTRIPNWSPIHCCCMLL